VASDVASAVVASSPSQSPKLDNAVEYHSRRYGRTRSTLRMAAIDDLDGRSAGADAAMDWLPASATAGVGRSVPPEADTLSGRPEFDPATRSGWPDSILAGSTLIRPPLRRLRAS
jgi:hypothetical protein